MQSCGDRHLSLIVNHEWRFSGGKRGATTGHHQVHGTPVPHQQRTRQSPGRPPGRRSRDRRERPTPFIVTLCSQAWGFVSVRRRHLGIHGRHQRRSGTGTQGAIGTRADDVVGFDSCVRDDGAVSAALKPRRWRQAPRPRAAAGRAGGPPVPRRYPGRIRHALR